MRVFVDINLWAYRVDQREPTKSPWMRSWSMMSRKLQPPLPDVHATALLDALIAEVAIRSQCSVLFSEDFGHSRIIAGLQICNPFVDGAWH